MSKMKPGNPVPHALSAKADITVGTANAATSKLTAVVNGQMTTTDFSPDCVQGGTTLGNGHTTPYIGDPIFTPNPGESGFIYATPQPNALSYLTVLYWGILFSRKSGDGIEYRVVDPTAMTALNLTPYDRLIARCDSQADAQWLCDRLNGHPDTLPSKRECSCLPNKSEECSSSTCKGGTELVKCVPKDLDPFVVKDNIQRLEGRVLRVIDAAITNEKQHGAISSLIRKETRHTIGHLGRLSFGGGGIPEAYSYEGDSISSESSRG